MKEITLSGKPEEIERKLEEWNKKYKGWKLIDVIAEIKKNE